MLADLRGRGEDLEYIVVSGNPTETAAWIKQLAVDGVTGRCDASEYCPEDPVTRGQKAIFLVRTFNLPSSPIIESTSAFSIIPLLQVWFPAINSCRIFCRTFGLCFVLDFYRI
jgi:hypothetical protein